LEPGIRRWDGAVISAGIAHVLAWFASLFMAFGPVYQGVSSTVETRPGGFAIESVETSETLLEANGLSMLPLLVGPVVLTALVVAILMTTRIKPSKRKVPLWVAAVLLLGFGVVGTASIGIFYLPAAVALLVAAVMGSRGEQVRA
jgi:hypothetical protein